MATMTEPRRRNATRMTREQAAEALLPLLTDEPQPEQELRRQLFPGTNGQASGRTDAARLGLRVLEAQHAARYIERQPGHPKGGWVRAGSPHLSAIPSPEEVEFPYRWAMVGCEDMFIDKSYQRPLTSFVDKIEKDFDPVLFQTLALNDRGEAKSRKQYAIIDGQTRWVAATRLGIVEVPCIVFQGLTIEQEADMFARLQKNRKGMTSWHRFRAELRAKKPEAVAIHQLVTSIGYEMGDGPSQIKAVAALEAGYRTDPETLERGLIDMRDAYGDKVPEAPHIRGICYFLRRYPIDSRKKEVVDDSRLVRRLKMTNLDELKRKALIQKEAARKKRGGTAEKWMGLAFENVYAGG